MNKFIFFLSLFFLTQTVCFAKSLEFAVVSDTHLIPSEHPVLFSESEKNTIFTVESINKNDNIEFVVFLGDCIDKSNMESLQSFMNIVQNLNKPYYIVLGNHDSYAAGGIAKEDFIKFIHQYNKRQDKKETSFYFKASSDAYGIILDGSSWLVPGKHGRYLPEQLKEVEKLLKFKKNDMILIFQHFPLIPPNSNVSHYTLDAEPYIKLVEKYSNIVLIASGHFHKKKHVTDRNGIHHISAPALGTRINSSGSGQYEVIRVNYDKSFFTRPHNITVDVIDVDI